MKKLFLSVCLVMASMIISMPVTKAQLADGTIAPDWTLTDIDGNTWNLYDLLDQNISVFIDVFAVWCGPCWSYHNTGNLDALYETYGPDGTNEVMVFQIEGDGASTMDEMNGIGGGTMGNWVSGTPYPSILTHYGDPSYDVIGDYDIAYFPTIYRICPNRVIKEVGQVTTAVLYNSVGECEMATTAVDPGIMEYTGPVASCSDVELSVKIQNMGFDNLTSCTIKAFNGGTELISKDWTGDLGIYEIQDIVLGSVTLPDPSTDVDITITSPDDNAANNTVSTNISYENNVSMIIHMEIKTDNYPTQTHWEIIDESTGDQIYDGGPYSSTQKNMVVVDEDFVLPGIGCYTLNFFDTGGDGITGSGYYKLYDENGDLLSSGFEGIGFKQSDALKVTGLNAIEDNITNGNFIVYPNPANTAFTAQFNLNSSEEISFAVVDMTGRTVKTIAAASYPSGSNSVTINTTDIAGGMYALQIIGAEKMQSINFTVAH